MSAKSKRDQRAKMRARSKNPSSILMGNDTLAKSRLAQRTVNESMTKLDRTQVAILYPHELGINLMMQALGDKYRDLPEGAFWELFLFEDGELIAVSEKREVQNENGGQDIYRDRIFYNPNEKFFGQLIAIMDDCDNYFICGKHVAIKGSVIDDSYWSMGEELQASGFYAEDMGDIPGLIVTFNKAYEDKGITSTAEITDWIINGGLEDEQE